MSINKFIDVPKAFKNGMKDSRMRLYLLWNHIDNHNNLMGKNAIKIWRYLYKTLEMLLLSNGNKNGELIKQGKNYQIREQR